MPFPLEDLLCDLVAGIKVAALAPGVLSLFKQKCTICDIEIVRRAELLIISILFCCLIARLKMPTVSRFSDLNF